MDDRCWVFTAIVCKHCDKVIYGRNTLRDGVARPALLRGAKQAGAVKRGEYWFCGRGCRTAHELNPGVPKNTPSWPIDLD